MTKGPSRGLEAAAIAANRFGMGARPGEMDKIAADPRGWLIAQMTPETETPAPLAALPTGAQDLDAYRAWVTSIGLAPDMARPAGTAAAPDMAEKPPPGMTVEQSFRKVLGERYVTAVGARFDTAVQTERPFFERWVRFWSNHFTVSVTKPQVIALPVGFERQAIRAHATGRFTDMLTASTQHPGMLIYLDNYLSIGPDSVAARKPQVLPAGLQKRVKGLNENLAREVMELHTLGVRSGYTQEDVTSLARMITGWTVQIKPQQGSQDNLFRFAPLGHEPGPQTLMGRTYAQAGVAQGEAALADLAANPATARHCAMKIARHFVGDNPPPAVVDRLAQTFQKHDGDLQAVALALVRSPEAWAPQPAKMKSPDDFMVSAVRAMGGPQMPGRQVVGVLTRMGQRPWAAPGPDGWPDADAAWIGSDAVWKRIEWASAAGRRMATAGVDPAAVAQAVLGPQLTQPTLQAIRSSESPAQGLAMLLVSPEFQRR